MEVNMIVCVAENNLMGDKNPEGNGLLWHSKEELNYFKEKTIGNVVIFGKNTAKCVPIELMKKNRDVIVISSKDNFNDIVDQYKYTDKDIFICGGATVYKDFLEKYKMDNIYVSVLKSHIDVKKPNKPLYFPNIEEFGYEIVESVEYNDFTVYKYQNKTYNKILKELEEKNFCCLRKRKNIESDNILMTELIVRKETIEFEDGRIKHLYFIKYEKFDNFYTRAIFNMTHLNLKNLKKHLRKMLPLYEKE